MQFVKLWINDVGLLCKILGALKVLRVSYRFILAHMNFYDLQFLSFFTGIALRRHIIY